MYRYPRPEDLPTMDEITALTARGWACNHHERLDVILGGMRTWADIMTEVRSHERQPEAVPGLPRNPRAYWAQQAERDARQVAYKREKDRERAWLRAQNLPLNWFRPPVKLR